MPPQTTDEMCYVFLLFTSSVVNVPYTAITAGVTSTSPQATSVDCTAASTTAVNIPFSFSLVPPWMAAHAVLAAIGYGFFMPLGAIFPASRKFRARVGSKWFNLHKMSMRLGGLMGIAAFILMAVYRTSAVTISSHGQMGIALLVLTVTQGAFGQFRPHLPKNPDEAKTQARKAFEYLHPSLGWVIMGCIAVQIFWGYELLGLYYSEPALQTWKWIHVCGIFPLWAVVMVILHPPPFLTKGQAVDDDLTLSAKV
jgi:hypothetical protein